MDKKQIKAIPWILIVLTILLFVCISTFSILKSGFVLSKVILILAINIIPTIIIAGIDYGIIIHLKAALKNHPVLGLTADFIFTNTALLFLIYTIGIPLFSYMYPGREINFPIMTTTSLLSNILFVMLIEIYVYYNNKMEAERRAAEAEKENISYQFAALKKQLNPHFLFNSLNVLSSLIYHDANKANIFTKKLSAIYRYLLNTDKRSLVRLDEELEFVKDYIFLQKIRFGENIQVEIKNETQELQSYVVPASIQILVENAIKHNQATKDCPLKINIEIKNNCIVVSNNLQLLPDMKKNGIGLTNLSKQYELQNKTIMIEKDEHNFRVTIPIIRK